MQGLLKINAFVFNISCSTLRTIMRIKATLISLLSIFMLLWSYSGAAQEESPPEPGGPPPPGLIVPIDFGIPGVMAGGLLIGIYFLRNRNVTSQNR